MLEPIRRIPLIGQAANHIRRGIRIAAACRILFVGRRWVATRRAQGLIRYRDRTVRIETTDELRAELLEVIEEMQALLQDGEARRDHNQARRCAGCSVAYTCDERLA